MLFNCDDAIFFHVYRNFYGLTADIDPKLTFMRGTVDSYHLYYHHPIIKQLFKANKNVHADQVSKHRLTLKAPRKNASENVVC